MTPDEKPLIWPIKRPAAAKTYGVDWSNRLHGRTIESATVTVLAGGLVKRAQAVDGPLVKVKLSGGVAGQTGRVACGVTYSDGDVDEVVVLLPVRA